MKIQFCGAAAGVTGSCHLLTVNNHKILLDCGQFQGGKEEEAKNQEAFPFNPADIECVVLSHAHIDHCGRLPLLINRGFKGKIYCTDATADLLEVMLKDSGYIHEKEAEWQNRKNERAGRPLVKPLYTYNDALDCLKHVVPVMYNTLLELNEDMQVVFNEAGHILGSAIIEIFATEGGETKKVVFSGDLGMKDRPILRDPVTIKKADCVIMETTYGNRMHPAAKSRMDELMDIVAETVQRGGTVVIPSFAVGRTQELLYELNRYYEDPNCKYKDLLANLMVYVDSPMATTATEVFKNNAQVFDDETKEFILKGDNPLDFPNLKFTRSTEDSQALNANREPKIIISASGMCEAGRIRHHLKHNLWDANSSVLFVGYQAEGTLGRALTEGLKDVQLFGEDIHVNAQIHMLEGFSGHADKQALLEWLGGFQDRRPAQVYLVHGETDAKEEFAKTAEQELGYKPIIVRGISEFELMTGEKLSEMESAPAGTATQKPVRVEESDTYKAEQERKAARERQAEEEARRAPQSQPREERQAEEEKGGNAPAQGRTTMDGAAPVQREADQGGVGDGRYTGPRGAGYEAAVNELVDGKTVEQLKEKIATVQKELEQVVANSEGGLDKGVSAGRMAEIEEILSELEKSTLNLGSTMTKEDRPDQIIAENGGQSLTNQ